LSLFVHLWMFFLWVLLFALWQARRLYQAVPNRQSPAYWVSCLTTMLILLGQSVQDSAGGQDVVQGLCRAHGTVSGGVGVCQCHAYLD
jgi:hypothetical protein